MTVKLNLISKKEVLAAIRFEMKRRKVSQLDLARAANIAPSNFSRAFVGNVSMSVAVILAICDAIDADPYELASWQAMHEIREALAERANRPEPSRDRNGHDSGLDVVFGLG